MRRSFLPVMLACVSYASFAHAQTPTFRPLDPTMQITPAAKPATPMVAPVAAPAPTPQLLTAPTPAPRPARNGEIIDSVGSNAIPALPLEVMTNNGVSYISGGIGDEEKLQLEQQEGQYNLRLLITGMNGEYLSNVRFILNDASTKVLLDIPDAGPFVYMLVPAGHYTVQALAPNGSGKAMPVKVPAGGSLKGQIRL